MDTKVMTDQVRLARWARIMRERVESGKKIRKYCEENGINEKTYYYWQRKLRKVACDACNGTKILSVSSTNIVPQKFAEAEIISTEELSTTAKTDGTGVLKIEIKGIQITAGNDYPVEMLSILLRKLAQL